MGNGKASLLNFASLHPKKICRKGEQLHPSQQRMLDGKNLGSCPSSPLGSVTSHYNNEIEDWDRNLFACCFQPCLCMFFFPSLLGWFFSSSCSLPMFANSAHYLIQQGDIYIYIYIYSFDKYASSVHKIFFWKECKIEKKELQCGRKRKNMNFVCLWQNKKETTMKNNIETKTKALARVIFYFLFFFLNFLKLFHWQGTLTLISIKLSEVGCNIYKSVAINQVLGNA